MKRVFEPVLIRVVLRGARPKSDTTKKSATKSWNAHALAQPSTNSATAVQHQPNHGIRSTQTRQYKIGNSRNKSPRVPRLRLLDPNMAKQNGNSRNKIMESAHTRLAPCSTQTNIAQQNGNGRNKIMESPTVLARPKHGKTKRQQPQQNHAWMEMENSTRACSTQTNMAQQNGNGRNQITERNTRHSTRRTTLTQPTHHTHVSQRPPQQNRGKFPRGPPNFPYEKTA